MLMFFHSSVFKNARTRDHSNDEPYYDSFPMTLPLSSDFLHFPRKETEFFNIVIFSGLCPVHWSLLLLLRLSRLPFMGHRLRNVTHPGVLRFQIPIVWATVQFISLSFGGFHIRRRGRQEVIRETINRYSHTILLYILRRLSSSLPCLNSWSFSTFKISLGPQNNQFPFSVPPVIPPIIPRISDGEGRDPSNWVCQAVRSSKMAHILRFTLRGKYTLDK